MHSQDIIRIINASFYAYHGVATDEQNLGGKFEVDVEIGARRHPRIGREGDGRGSHARSLQGAQRN